MRQLLRNPDSEPLWISPCRIRVPLYHYGWPYLAFVPSGAVHYITNCSPQASHVYNRIQTSIQELSTDQMHKMKQAAKALRVSGFPLLSCSYASFVKHVARLIRFCIGVKDAN
jgi:hypothetical protein